MDQPGKSYTANTVRHLQARWPGCEIFLVVGSDMLLSFSTWYCSGWLLQNVTLVAQSRDEGETAAMGPAVEDLRRQGGRVLFLRQPVCLLSSTEVRARCAAGEDISALVPPEALRVIRRRGLYLDPTGGKCKNGHCGVL